MYPEAGSCPPDGGPPIVTATDPLGDMADSEEDSNEGRAESGSGTRLDRSAGARRRRALARWLGPLLKSTLRDPFGKSQGGL
jgi:hypothetical protein